MARAKVLVSYSLIAEKLFSDSVEVVGFVNYDENGVFIIIEGYEIPESNSEVLQEVTCAISQSYEFKAIK